ncbi:MAG: nucleotidyltransferase domain-containing protein [Armatimonadetes bacterium]|nr:nucleotidyltransferase domain-containing protein [Armatimonadota bacterium]
MKDIRGPSGKPMAGFSGDFAVLRPAVCALFSEFPEIELAYLFGSQGSRRATPSSDIDLALLSKGLSLARYRMLWSRLVEILGTEKVDVLFLEDAPPALRFEVIRSGRILFRSDPDRENRFELLAMKEYWDTAPLRRIRREALYERWGMGGLPKGEH